MRRLRFFTALSLISTLLLSSCSKERPLPIPDDDKTLSETLSNSSVTCFTEDARGYIWIGTERGLNRFDGTEYVQYFHSSSPKSLMSNRITALHADSERTLWVGTSTGVNSISDDDRFVPYDIASVSKVVGGIYEHGGDIYISTLGTLLKLDKEKRSFQIVVDSLPIAIIRACVFTGNDIVLFLSNRITRFDTLKGEISETLTLPSALVSALYDGDRFVYCSTEDELLVYDAVRNRIEYRRPTSEVLRFMAMDGNRIVTYGGGDLSLFDGDGLTFSGDIGFKPHSEVSTCHLDSNGNLWVGYATNGYAVSYKYDRDFYASDEALKRSLAEKNVTTIATGPDGRIWFVTDHNRLFVYESGALREIDLTKALGQRMDQHKSISGLFAGDGGTIWLGINSHIIQCSYDGKTFRADAFHGIWGNTVALGSADVSDHVINSFLLVQDRDGTMWVGYLDGYFRYLDADGEYVRIPIENPSLTHMGAMILLSDGNIAGGFYGRDLQILDPRSKEIVRTIPLSVMDADRFYLTALCEDHEGGLWVGFRTEGVIHIHPDYQTMERVEGLSCNDVCDIVCDDDGSIWISTYDGLSRYRTQTGTVSNYYKEDSIGGNQFNYHSAALFPDGKLLLGGTHGLTVIDPDAWVERSDSVPFYFENLFINNRLVRPETSGHIGTALVSAPKVTLFPDDRQVAISFSALDYGHRNHLLYSYALDKTRPSDWVQLGTHGTASFNKFPYGKHTLYARVTSPDNPGIDQVINLPIVAKRPLLASRFATLLYLLAFLLAVTFFIVLQSRLYKTQIEKRSQQEINEMNMRFFANVSHEFRTPLTMVNGAIKQLNRRRLEEEERGRLYEIINRNADRMVTLVDQLMDYNRIDSDVMTLLVRKEDAIAIVERIVDDFRHSVARREDMIKFRRGVEILPMLVDRDKLEKILYNLLSNAFKFTPAEKGRIAVDADLISRSEASEYFPLSEQDVDIQYFFVSIFNSGSFIPEDKLTAIFERFTQLKEGSRRGGTGIGLYYAKRLVDIHHGHIKAANKTESEDPERNGVVFTFILPVNDIAYAATERWVDTEQDTLSKTIPDPVPKEETVDADNVKPTLLVIDDDPEVIFYLKTLLAKDYRVLDTQTAEDGFHAVGQLNPDIILCDVLLPGMDGFELCGKIKGDLSVCHIPCILLTAKFSIEDQIRGLNAGANAYVVKPFDPDYLAAVLKSQLDNRNRIREVLTHHTDGAEVEDTLTGDLDKAFIADLYRLMDQSSGDPDMDITGMAKSLNVSRSQLFYKVKALTGETPHAFFNHYKLNIAAKRILEDKYKISAIAQDLGFVSASHFTSLFKKEFGCLPSDYKRLSSRGNHRLE